jgi:hypothetical protein
MAWRFRRSIRLPFGCRLNFSRTVIGWSWGFPGLRVGIDSKGRITRTVSIPGMGIYNRAITREPAARTHGKKQEEPQTDTQARSEAPGH